MRRPDTIDGFQAAMAQMLSEEGLRHAAAFKPRASDVIIAPYGKSGTTWTQQIVHTLRTGGDIDHDDISAGDTHPLSEHVNRF